MAPEKSPDNPAEVPAPAPAAPPRERPRWVRALVTGASSGIGESFARLLAEEGTHLVLVARRAEALESLAAELRERFGVEVEVLVADLADTERLRSVEDRLGDQGSPVDLLVNNAGFGYNRPFLDIGVDDEDEEIRVNILALVRLSHAAARSMVAAGRGAILNVASVAAFQPAPTSANYSATKAYVTSFSQSIHEELAPHGVTVTVLCPGLTRTEFQARGGYEIGLPGLFWQSSEEVARVGLDACARGAAVKVPGVHNKVMVQSVRLLPMTLQRKVAAQVTRRLR